MLFTPIKNQLDSDLKIKLNGKNLYETELVKLLKIKLERS